MPFSEPADTTPPFRQLAGAHVTDELLVTEQWDVQTTGTEQPQDADPRLVRSLGSVHADWSERQGRAKIGAVLVSHDCPRRGMGFFKQGIWRGKENQQRDPVFGINYQRGPYPSLLLGTDFWNMAAEAAGWPNHFAFAEGVGHTFLGLWGWAETKDGLPVTTAHHRRPLAAAAP